MSASGRELKKWERPGARVPAFVDQWGRTPFFVVLGVMFGAAAGMCFVSWPVGLVLGAAAVAFGAMGFADITQQSHTILRNFPVLGRLRYFFESVRPELRQYFVESDQEQNPYSRENRSIIYQRAKSVLATLPFGTRADVYSTGYTWIAHSMVPTHPLPSAGRILVGEKRCKHPYDASIFNISAMSYGSLSKNAVLALNKGAKLSGFAHNTGEGGVSPYHLEAGGDLVWQVGTGYFGCRAEDGGFSEERFVETVKAPSIKMIELKLSQGAKPGHGGILPAKKVTLEISQIRGVPMGQDVNSPPGHSAFSTPRGLIEFVTRLRELSGGRPVGIKVCIGHPGEFLAVVKAMVETGEGPDFITVDGGEGGTGAAPLEFSNSVGAPLRDGLLLVDDALRGAGLRNELKIFSAGKIATGFNVLEQLALGADACNSARGMMFALGCIQALKCNTNKCPAGVATQEPRLVEGLHVDDKAFRVASFHDKTVESVLELCGAAGLESPVDLRREHLTHRISPTEVQTFQETFPLMAEGALLDGTAPPLLQKMWDEASADTFCRPAIFR